MERSCFLDNSVYHSVGAYGIQDDLNSGQWCNGEMVEDVPEASCNSHGRVFGSGDRVGVLADMDRRCLTFYRNGKRLAGVERSGLAAEVYPAATLWPDDSPSVVISFPPAPQP